MWRTVVRKPGHSRFQSKTAPVRRVARDLKRAAERHGAQAFVEHNVAGIWTRVH